AEYVGTTTTYNPLGGSAAVNTIGPTLDAPVGVRQATSLQSAFRTARKADNGWRLWVNSDGGHTWGDGTTYVPAGPTLGYDATNGNLAVSGGLMRTGRRGDVAVSHNISTAGQATTCDTKAYSVHSFSLFANAGAVTLSNAVEGAEVTLIVAQDATGGRTFTWPTALYANNAAPADTGPNSVNIVALRYTSGGWIETWRRITHSWTNATVTGITTNPSGSGAPVGYTKINGVVYLRGLAASVAVNATLFTLPAGYRPPYQLTVPIFTMNGSAAITAGYLTVGADGTVRMPSGAGALVSFDGVTFPAEA
ncbi:MAG: hypothetical protein FWE71_09895, partial [Nocardioidaceae bacterium]|nr:hypothetical protein [Nocardioidaceae bacterium]